MGTTPQEKDITIEFDCLFRVNLKQCDFLSFMKALLILLTQLLGGFFQKVLVGFGEYKIAQQKNHFLVDVVAMIATLCGRRGMVRQRLFLPGFVISRPSKWSTEGALNVTDILLAYYYNGFDAR